MRKIQHKHKRTRIRQQPCPHACGHRTQNKTTHCKTSERLCREKIIQKIPTSKKTILLEQRTMEPKLLPRKPKRHDQNHKIHTKPEIRKKNTGKKSNNIT